MTTIIVVVLLLAVTAYAVFAGADFGAGFWDLIAGGDERGEQPRSVIERAIGPVWEGNHVWLIFGFVILWSGFAEAYASVALTLYVPLTIAALGIVLRGAGFAFRKSVSRTRHRRIFGGAFAIPSVIVPYCLGTVVGAIASGRVPAGGVAGDLWSSWINPTSILVGVLAVTMAAYLATVYLSVDAHRLSDRAMVDYFRRRAVASAVVAGIVAGVGIAVLRSDARFVFNGLMTRALPFVVLSTLCGAGSLLLLLRRAHFVVARALAAAAVALVVVSWGFAQWDYILPETLTVSEASAPGGTLVALLVVAVAGLVFIGPAFLWLYRLHQRGTLEEDDGDGALVHDA
ncbi:MAG: cytochrome d ubiquinol oxidase subunit II [Gemmatimonas sp.]|nr:cytochrome d ubiquinol oxidase subunit II [Gemmatimonas sp.]